MSLLRACFTAVATLGATTAALAVGCVPERSALPEAVLSGYRANPTELLIAPDSGGGLVSSRIRNAVASDPSLVPALAPTMKAAQGDDARSIGLGLGSAAQICTRSFPSVAQSIQRAVSDSDNPELQRAFAAIIGDQAVSSIGGPGGGSVAGQATPGGGTHRPTDTPTYAFSRPTDTINPGSFLGGLASSSTAARSALQSSSVAFRSVSGVR